MTSLALAAVLIFLQADRGQRTNRRKDMHKLDHYDVIAR